jgi:hypothetical protein
MVAFIEPLLDTPAVAGARRKAWLVKGHSRCPVRGLVNLHSKPVSWCVMIAMRCVRKSFQSLDASHPTLLIGGNK